MSVLPRAEAGDDGKDIGDIHVDGGTRVGAGAGAMAGLGLGAAEDDDGYGREVRGQGGG